MSHICKAEARLYDFAKEYFGKDVFLVLNTEESLDIPSKFNKIIFNSKTSRQGAILATGYRMALR